MDNDKIYIIDENGNEKLMNILFTFENDDRDYVVVYDEENDEDLYAFQYDEDGNLLTVDDEEELEMVQEVIDAFDGVDIDEEEK